jgi:hypothetical protein
MSDDLRDAFWRPPYDVGYKKPPESRRFAKGTSGNPRGRPSKKKPNPKPLVDKSTMESVLKVALREVTAREGDNLTKISAFDAVIQTMAAAAMKGSVPAQKIFVELVDRARKERATEISEDHEFWRTYAANYGENFTTLQKTGKPVPDNWPHPDDIVFEDGEHVKFMGGEPAIAVQNRNTIIRFRDVLMLQAEMDRRCFLRDNPGRAPPIFVSDYLMVHANSCLPVRKQLDDSHLLIRILRIETLRKAELQRQLKENWAEFGLTLAPNRTTPPLLTMLGIDASN